MSDSVKEDELEPEPKSDPIPDPTDVVPIEPESEPVVEPPDLAVARPDEEGNVDLLVDVVDDENVKHGKSELDLDLESDSGVEPEQADLTKPDQPDPDKTPLGVRRSERLKGKERRVIDDDDLHVADELGYGIAHSFKLRPKVDEVIDVDDADDVENEQLNTSYYKTAQIVQDEERIDIDNQTEIEAEAIKTALTSPEILDKIRRTVEASKPEVHIGKDLVMDPEIFESIESMPPDPRTNEVSELYEPDETQQFDLLDRISRRTLLNDPAMKTISRFTKASLLQNQCEYPQYAVIRGYLKGEPDMMDDAEKLPWRTRQKLKDGRFTLDNDDLIVFIADDGKHRVLLPPEHRHAILHWTHCNMLTGGHMGITAMEAEIRQKWYWEGFQSDIKEFVSCCQCQFAKDRPPKRNEPLHLFPARYVNEMVAIDHAGPLPESPNGNRYITTFYDRYSGYARSVAVKSIDSLTTALSFIANWVSLFGPPEIALTDNGSDFRS